MINDVKQLDHWFYDIAVTNALKNLNLWLGIMGIILLNTFTLITVKTGDG